MHHPLIIAPIGARRQALLTERLRCDRPPACWHPESGAPSDRPRKTVTDCARSGPRPIPLARPPEFVVCPLMCEIRAFRYFWPFYDSVVGGQGGLLCLTRTFARIVPAIA